MSQTPGRAPMNARGGPSPSTAAVSRRMSRQRRGDTSPEVTLRRALHRDGLRFRVGFPVPGQPRRSIDIAFPRIRVAVFVDGCFWHACPEHASWPTSNAAWWRQKLARNVERDRESDDFLERAGWHVIRVWEHEDPRSAAVQVANAVASRRAATEDVPRGT
ncbi:very short patch repair endonuclease [Microvirga sp. 0TCS3.31]